MPRRFLKILLLLLLAGALVAAILPNAGGASGNGIAQAIAVQERHNAGLFANHEVAGTAVGVNENGATAVIVFVRHSAAGVPSSLDGVPVVTTVAGDFSALGKPQNPGGGGTTIDPKSHFTRPVPIGVSTGNAGECSAGTISARVKDSGGVYALSNNHVYALENSAPLGSEVLQPGLYDTGCVLDSTNNHLGNLSRFVDIAFDGSSNTVDAAIAATDVDHLGKATPLNGYGAPSSQTSVAFLNERVEKYGRTTSLTTGQVYAINWTGNIGYSSGTALFEHQIVVYGNKPVIKPGDSGSLLVDNSTLKPVGLLFAGTSDGKYAIGNQIDSVLSALGVTIDGTP